MRTIVPLQNITLQGISLPIDKLPPPLIHHPESGVVAPAAVCVRSLHIDEFVCHPRAVRALNGDWLLFYAAGPMHYAWAKFERGNRMFLRRSRDNGRTWSPPQVSWDIPHSQHAVVPFRPRNGRRIYAFGTEPRADVYDGGENAAIGYRFSDDDGNTWSAAEFIRPVNDPEFRGMSAMRMCETDSGAWLLGSHVAHWGENGDHVVTEQYVLRSENQGRDWIVLPGKRPDGWQVPGFGRMDEGRPIHLGGNRVLMFGRTPEGHLWRWISNDAGKTWTQPAPTPLRHLEAPPMVFLLRDGKTLVAFIHNRLRDDASLNLFAHELRAELWACLSRDGGDTWSEPRFILGNAAQPAILSGWGGNTPMVSYGDLLVDGENLHLFVDHQMRQILQITFREKDLTSSPFLSDLKQAPPFSPAPQSCH